MFIKLTDKELKNFSISIGVILSPDDNEKSYPLPIVGIQIFTIFITMKIITVLKRKTYVKNRK